MDPESLVAGDGLFDGDGDGLTDSQEFQLAVKNQTMASIIHLTPRYCTRWRHSTTY